MNKKYLLLLFYFFSIFSITFINCILLLNNIVYK